MIPNWSLAWHNQPLTVLVHFYKLQIQTNKYNYLKYFQKNFLLSNKLFNIASFLILK